ncbi:hypothetical protein AB0J52_20270 [Spirillospora sp. NPDC049652]
MTVLIEAGGKHKLSPPFVVGFIVIWVAVAIFMITKFLQNRSRSR